MKLPIPNTTKLGFVGIFRMSMENFSRIVFGLISITFLFLKETQHLQKVQTIMATPLVLMATNNKNVMVIILYLTVLESNRPITVAMVDEK